MFLEDKFRSKIFIANSPIAIGLIFLLSLERAVEDKIGLYNWELWVKRKVEFLAKLVCLIFLFCCPWIVKIYFYSLPSLCVSHGRICLFKFWNTMFIAIAKWTTNYWYSFPQGIDAVSYGQFFMYWISVRPRASK